MELRKNNIDKTFNLIDSGCEYPMWFIYVMLETDSNCYYTIDNKNNKPIYDKNLCDYITSYISSNYNEDILPLISIECQLFEKSKFYTYDYGVKYDTNHTYCLLKQQLKTIGEINMINIIKPKGSLNSIHFNVGNICGEFKIKLEEKVENKKLKEMKALKTKEITIKGTDLTRTVTVGVFMDELGVLSAGYSVTHPDDVSKFDKSLSNHIASGRAKSSKTNLLQGENSITLAGDIDKYLLYAVADNLLSKIEKGKIQIKGIRVEFDKGYGKSKTIISGLNDRKINTFNTNDNKKTIIHSGK